MGYGGADVRYSGGAEPLVVAWLVDGRAVVFEVEPQEADLEPPVEERARGDAGPGDALLVLPEVIGYRAFGAEEGDKGQGAVVLRVAAEVAGDEALDARFDGGVDEGDLRGEGGAGYSGDDGVLAGEGLDEGGVGVV